MLKKLSLAALVAMGSMSVASASTDLSEAIKGVTIGGYLRYRGTQTDDYEANSENRKDNRQDTNEYKVVLNTDIKVSDTVTAHGRLVWVDGFVSNNDSNGEAKSAFNVREAYLKYNKDSLNVKAGFQALATPLTDHDDDYANGILATDTFEGVTLAGAYFNQISNAGGQVTAQNIYVLAAIADIKPVKVQAWYYNIGHSDGDTENDGAYRYFLEAAANLGPVALKTQYAGGKDTDAVNGTKQKNQRFFAIAATGKVDVASITAAYLKFGKEGSNVTVGTANADQQIAAGDILTDNIQQDKANLKDGSAFALVASAKVMDKTTVGAQYVLASTNDVDNASNATYAEYDLDAAYQYNKKLKFSGYYAILNKTVGKNATATPTSGTSRQTEARFEAKYSF
jgi:hypothetical protein